jgi:glycosyltransferase involved in cell wall biosynthesis
MRIAHVCNFWPNRYGLAHYCGALLRGIAAARPGKQYVIGEGNSAAHDDDLYQCVPAWRRDSDYVEPIVAALRGVRADVAVLQYVSDLFGDDARFPRLLAAIDAAGIRTVVMPHSIYPPGRRTRVGTARDLDLAMAAHAGRFAVHTARMRADLVARGIPAAQIAVIPHGSEAMEARDPGASRDHLGLPRGAPIIMFFGFIWIGKGVPFLIDAFARLGRRVPDARLFVAGYTKLRRWGVGDRLHLSGAYVPDADVPACYAAADVVAMPYRQDYSSASGVVHQAAGLGKLMVCSRIAKFDEVGEAISPDLLVDPRDRDGWADALARLLTDAPYAESLRDRIRAFAHATRWEEVGRQHAALYAELLASGSVDRASDPTSDPASDRASGAPPAP